MKANKLVFFLVIIWNILSFTNNYKISFEKNNNENILKDKSEKNKNKNYFDVLDDEEYGEPNNNFSGKNLWMFKLLENYYDEFINKFNDFRYLMMELYLFYDRKIKKNNENILEEKFSFKNEKQINNLDNSIKDNSKKFDSLRILDEKNEEMIILTPNITINNTNIDHRLNKNDYIRCSGRGNLLYFNYTEYYCDNKTISKKEYEEIEKNSTLFNSKNCTNNTSIKDICICPKNLRGIECELEIPFKCKIKNLLVKNNTQENKINLLDKKNTFYYEYFNTPDVYCLFNNNNEMNNKQNFLNYNLFINCTDEEIYDYNYTITLGNLNEDQIGINVTDYLSQNLNFTNFDYFIEEKSLTVGLPIDLYLRFKIYDMDSLMPYITLYFPFIDNSTLTKNKFNFYVNNKTNNNNNKDKIVSQGKILGKNSNHEYDLFILNSETIRDFICNDFDCEKDQKIEDIIKKNYKNKNYYINFSNNLMKYINRKNNIFNSNKFNNFDYDSGQSEYILKEGLKFSNIKDEYVNFVNENINENEKQKIKNLLTGIESFDFKINFEKLNLQLLDLKNEYDLNELIKGGRIFYEFEIVDEINDYVFDCIYQGEIILKDKFDLKSDYFWIIYLAITLIILSAIIYYCYFNKKEDDLKNE